ncbi:MAG: ribonuclease H-like domain-containing protein [Anaerolineae bacterium]
MDIKERLQKAGLLKAEEGDRDGPSPRKERPTLASLTDGHWIQTAQGRCLVVEREYSLEERHGSPQLLHALGISDDTWTPFIIGEKDDNFDLQKALFIDTETTGLDRGGGTYVFLVGLGFFQEDRFRLLQYFMPDYGEEGALLHLLAEHLVDHQGLVSFNGRSFDWPLLRTRYILSQGKLAFDDTPHLDLLLLARRLWRRILPSCALSCLESTVLDVEREGTDVPGYEIPQIYTDYVEWGCTKRLANVFYHNRIDVLSMVALAARIGATLEAPFTRDDDPYCDFLALGRAYEAMGETDRAIRAYQRARQQGERQTRDAACKRLSFLLKRLGRYEKAAQIWQELLDGNKIYPYIELAKQLEHRDRDYIGAKRMTLEAMACADPKDKEVLQALEHRLERLQRRLNKTAKG